MESNSFSDLMALVLKQEQIEQLSTEQHLDSACRINDIEVIELLERVNAKEDATVTDNVGMVDEVGSVAKVSELVSAMVAAMTSEAVKTIEVVTIEDD